MSRYIATHRTNETLSFHYGFDRTCGYFYQIYDTAAEDPEWPIVDRDSLFHGLTGAEMAETLKVANVPDSHILAMLLDNTF